MQMKPEVFCVLNTLATASAMIPSVVGCLGGEMMKLKSNLKELFDNEKELDKTVHEMQKTVLWQNESIIRKVLSGLLLTNVLPLIMRYL